MRNIKFFYISKKYLLLLVLLIIGLNSAKADLPSETEEEYTEVAENLNVVNHSYKKEVENNFYSFKPKQLILPGALLGLGILGIWEFSGLKNHIRNNWSIVKYGKRIILDDYLRYAPIPFYVGMGFIPGIPHRSSWEERLMAGVTAYAVMTIFTNSLKYTFKVDRPDSSSRNSFPSGHTATAFTGAELMRIEYGTWIGCVGYIMAGCVAALRIYNNRHWLSDVLGGAGIGILSARIGYWLVPWERKIFKLDKKRKNISVIATPIVGQCNGFSFFVDL